MDFDIYLSPPNMSGRERFFVQEAFDTNWIAPYGPALTAFETDVAHYVGVENALAVASGTAGIHLALRWLGVGRGDVVFCSDLTFAGSCNPILYQGAEPVFIDSEPESWNMSPVALERAFVWAEKRGKLPKAVIIVDLYGESADWDALLPICRRYGVQVIEDAAEALGASYGEKRCGTFGDIAVFSFNGNKIITTSGGGMVVSDNPDAIEKMRFWSTQAREPVPYYEHKEYGFNYRMSNICAAIGRGQLPFLEEKMNLRRKIYERYRAAMEGMPASIKAHASKRGANCWLSLLVTERDELPARIVDSMSKARIEARLSWKPMHMQPLYAGARCFAHGESRFVSEAVFSRAVCLPSGDGMQPAQQTRVIDELCAVLMEGKKSA